MLDHLTLKVRDLEKAKAFYTAALEPLGYVVMMEFGEFAGLGAGKPDLWLRRDPDNVRPNHVALAARDRKAVDAFYEAAMAAGATDNGKPGVRTDYHPTYYAAFILDSDGHNVEVVCHAPPGQARATAAKRSAKRSGAKRAPKKRASRGGAKRRKARGRG
jgi:catechol 2,3-dioxygenase-like lactoylglutathione lyase family enzyme